MSHAVAQIASETAKMTSKMPQRRLQDCQDGPKRAQDGPKMHSRRPTMHSTRPKMASRWSKTAPKRPPRGLQGVPQEGPKRQTIIYCP
eukprot:5314258-Pyramimonas_sp.AAC.2